VARDEPLDVSGTGAAKVAADPLAVWDTRGDGALWNSFTDGRFTQATTWAARHIQEPRITFRIEFYLIDAPFAVVYRYIRDEEDRLMHDPATGRPRATEPVIQMLDELPPAHLMRR
jgi:hypothetical protein